MADVREHSLAAWSVRLRRTLWRRDAVRTRRPRPRRVFQSALLASCAIRRRQDRIAGDDVFSKGDRSSQQVRRGGSVITACLAGGGGTYFLIGRSRRPNFRAFRSAPAASTAKSSARITTRVPLMRSPCSARRCALYRPSCCCCGPATGRRQLQRILAVRRWATSSRHDGLPARCIRAGWNRLVLCSTALPC